VGRPAAVNASLPHLAPRHTITPWRSEQRELPWFL